MHDRTDRPSTQRDIMVLHNSAKQPIKFGDTFVFRFKRYFANKKVIGKLNYAF